jgi:hypothetical protein
VAAVRETVLTGFIGTLWLRFRRWLLGTAAPLHIPEMVAGQSKQSSLEQVPPALAASGRELIESERAAAAHDRAAFARVFDAAHPGRVRSELFGRDAELSQLLETALHARKHMIVHGRRGAGKTSLARIFGDYADQQGAVVIYMACEASASFAGLMLPYLQALPDSALALGQASMFRKKVSELPREFGPRAFTEICSDLIVAPVIFILDEFDCISDAQVKNDISAAMKLLADALSEVLFMLVGIAATVSDVISAHQSLRRHLGIISLGQISTGSVEELVARGGRALGLTFTPESCGLISRAACGSPYHVRLFCLHASLAAAMARSRSVEASHVETGFLSACQAWCQTNEAAGRIFASAAEMSTEVASLEEIARISIFEGSIGLGTKFSAARALLRETLVRSSDLSFGETFEDPVAPQFLIALIIVAGRRDPKHVDGSVGVYRDVSVG